MQIKTVWTAVMVTELKHLVNEGLSQPQIAKRMNLPYHVVRTKIQNLRWHTYDSRRTIQSHIRADWNKSVQRVGMSTLPPLESLQEDIITNTE